MKKILFPTDFSALAAIAYQYCLKIAKQLEASVHVLHVYRGDFTVPVPEVMAYKLLEERKQATTKQMKAFVANNPEQIRVSTSVEMGLTTDVLIEYSEANDIDLIVMGTKGEHNLLEVALGSIASNTINRAACPVLVVPEEATISPLKKVAYATDLSEQNIEQLAAVIGWATQLKTALHYVFVHTTKTPVDEYRVDELLEAQTNGLAVTYHQVDNPYVAQGLQNFVEKEQIDLLMMHHPKKGFLEWLFTASETRQMAFQSKIPLLIWR